MPEPSCIDNWIKAALSHSSLPLSRRVETAEEWRAHLDQLIRDRQAAGLSEDQAQRAAIEAFGKPEQMRRQLRRQQWTLDRRAAVAEVRKLAWLFAFMPALYVALAVALTGPASVWSGLVAGIPLLLGTSLLMGLAVFFAALTQHRLTRRRPRGELSFPRRFILWCVVAAGGFAGMLVIPMLFLVSAFPLLMSKPWFAQAGPGAFSRFLWIATVERADVHVVGLLATSLILGFAAAVYERTRCVHARDSLAALGNP